MVRPIEERIVDERVRMKAKRDELLNRIEKEARGEKSKKLLKEILVTESLAHLYWNVCVAPPVVAGCKGSTMTDVDGNEYIDFTGGFGVHAIGFSHPKVVAAIEEQARRVLQYCEMPSIPRIELGKKMLEITPGNFEKKILWAVTGAEAIEAATRLARYYTGRTNLIAFTGAYHGRTTAAMALTANAYFKNFHQLPVDTAVVRFPYAYCYRCALGEKYPDCKMACTKYLENFFSSVHYGLRDPDKGITNVAGIVVEPCQGHAGYIVPPVEFLSELRKICDKYELLLIADEIMCGFGRTGKLWACEHSNVAPDLMCIGKAIGGGIPLSAVVGRQEILDYVGPGAHMGTFAGNHIACAAGLALVRVLLEEKIPERAAKTGKYLAEKWRALQDRHRLIGDVAGRGLFIGVELVKNHETKEPAAQETAWIQNECYKRGFLIQRAGYYGNRFNNYPTLIVTEEEIDRAMEVMDSVMSDAERKYH